LAAAAEAEVAEVETPDSTWNAIPILRPRQDCNVRITYTKPQSYNCPPVPFHVTPPSPSPRSTPQPRADAITIVFIVFRAGLGDNGGTVDKIKKKTRNKGAEKRLKSREFDR